MKLIIAIHFSFLLVLASTLVFADNLQPLTKIEKKLLKGIENPEGDYISFENSIKKWPDNKPIWPYLKTLDGKTSFLQYVIGKDDTHNREYEFFPSRCTGFATQIYLRYSSRANLSTEAIERIARVYKVEKNKMSLANKYKMPIFLGGYLGHYFNAVLVDDNKKQKLDSYIIFEPLTNELITSDTDKFNMYVKKFGVTFDDLLDVNEKNQLITKFQFGFVLDSNDKAIYLDEQDIISFYDFLLIYRTIDSQDMTSMIGRDDYKTFVIKLLKIYTDNQQKKKTAILKKIFPLLNGKTIPIDKKGGTLAINEKTFAELFHEFVEEPQK